jgi:sortase (surface protein transpeptidase)
VRSRRAVLLAGLAALGTTMLSSSRATAKATASVAPEAEAFRSARNYPVVSPPVRLRIPAAGVDSSLQPLGTAPDRTIEVPADFAVAGWFAGGPRPGQAGPAVILGHVDSTRGPAVFYRLRVLTPGAEVTVLRADGSTVAFQVTGVARVPKTAFPTAQVYGASLEPTLRLITCGGRFDRAVRSYEDNVIVYADLADGE